MSITIEDESGLTFELNQNNYTAKVIGSNATGNIYIPRSIIHQSQKYIITEINENSFQYNENIESIDFPDDSELLSIGQYALSFSSIKSITIPPSVKELKYGWCSHTWNLTTINLSSESKHFSYLDETQKIIVGKSDSKIEYYDVIIFGCRDIKTITIPSFITFICPFSFSGCVKLQKVRFSDDSQLESIGDFAFSFTSIKKITIPPHVRQIGESCFSECDNIQRFNFSENSELQIIGKGAFSVSSLDYILIPPKVNQIDECAFAECEKLQKVEFSNNSELKKISKNVFYRSSLEEISIPVHVTEICEAAFSECYSFQTISFPIKSELKIIHKNVFENSSIEKFYIPSNVTEIKDGWCSHTMNLTQISISPKNDNFLYLDDKILLGKSNSDSIIYDILLFARRDIEIAVIPSFVTKICQSAFSECKKLQTIIFSENSELESIGNSAFADSSISNFTVPFRVKEIGENAFNHCKCLKNVYFQENSELKTICEYAFSDSSIESISIPDSVEEIKNGWCCYTYRLNSISISPLNKNFSFLDETHKIVVGKTDPKIEYFDSIVFACRDICDLFVPSHIKSINSYSFFGCFNIKSIKFSIENSELDSIGKYAFSDSSIFEISLPNSVNKIGTGAFAKCKQLKKLNFPQNSEKMGICKNAMAQSSIQNVFIYSSNCLICPNAFSYCTDLLSFEFLGENISIDIFCFNHCENFKLISFPNANQVSIQDTAYSFVSRDFALYSLAGALKIQTYDMFSI